MEMLRVQNLTKSFKKLVAVSSLTFGVEKGEILGLMGPNGSGKTTLIHLITGFLNPEGGSINWKDEDITGWSPHRVVQTGIARTFQQTRVFPNLCVFDNLVVSLRRSKGLGLSLGRDEEQKIMEILEFVGIQKKMSTLAGQLPQNELRKLEIARAISSSPELVLLDEPVSGLTPEEGDGIARIITRLNESGVSLIVIEHVMRTLMKVSHRLIVMNSGAKICEGKPEEIRQDQRVIEAYFGKGAEGFVECK